MVTLTTIIILLSLGGLPPLTGFMPKFITVIILTESINLTVFILLLGSVINLYFYLNIAINTILSTPNTVTHSPIKPSVTRNLTIVAASLSLGIAPLIMLYAMTLFN